MTEENSVIDSDFNLEDDYKPEPIMRKAWYKGRVAEVTLDEEGARIAWKVTLDGNGGFMSDGETEVDGSSYVFNNWLPKAGDKDEPTKSGKGTKFQSKVNMLAKFSADMDIDMNNMASIRQNVGEQNWVGIPVLIHLAPEEYQGNVSMKGQNMKRREEED